MNGVYQFSYGCCVVWTRPGVVLRALHARLAYLTSAIGPCPCHLPSSLHPFLEENDTSPSLITCCWLTDAPTISIQNKAKKHHFGHISCARMLERSFVCHLSRLPEPPLDVSTPILRKLRHVWLVQ
ncbi:unnamed protein product, partial [Ectocarpus sp. 4 AP-2014]